MPTKPRQKLKLSVRATRLGIKVRRVTNSSRGAAFGYSWLVTVPSRVTGGPRIRQQFKASESRQAVDYAEGKANLAKTTGEIGFRLTEAQQVEAQGLIKRLLPLGISLTEAVECAIKHLRPEGGEITFGALRDRLIAEKDSLGRRKATTKNLRTYLGVLVRHFGAETPIKNASADSIRGWLESLRASGVSPRHLRNYVTYSKQFFRYAHAHRFVGENPTLLIQAPATDLKDPVILTIPEAKNLLSVALTPTHRELLPAVVLGMFCGLRTEEVSRLRWEQVNLKQRVIKIGANVAKTRDRRDVRIPKNAVEFLFLHKKREGEIAPASFVARLTELHTDAGFPNWKSTHANAKRHSFGSYAYKLHGMDWVIDQMGNSVRMFVKHYKNHTVTRRQATDYFKISPSNIEVMAEIVPIAKEA